MIYPSAAGARPAHPQPSNDHDDHDDEVDVANDDPLDRNPPSSTPSLRIDTTARRGSTTVHAYPSTSTPPIPSRRRRTLVENISRSDSGTSLDELGRPANGATYSYDAKQDTEGDWLSEGPGRRVGYDDLTAIDWIFEYAKERQRLRVLSATTAGLVGHVRRFIDSSHIWLVLTLTGIATGAIAASMAVASDWLADLKTGYCKTGEDGGRFYLNRDFCCWGHESLSDCKDWVPWNEAFNLPASGSGWPVRYVIFISFSILFASCASFLVGRFAIYARQSGIPEIKTVLGGYVIHNLMGTWTLAVKAIGLCLSVASGLWLGKEGPLVHVACCCAYSILRLFPTINGNEARKREVISAAAAAGISVAFGAPVGGVLFSLEQLSYYFPDKTMWQSFVCAMIAAVTLQAFNPFRTGKLVLYQVSYSSGWHAFELIPFALIGAIGGISGGLFIKLNMRIATWRKGHRLFQTPLLEVVVVTFITALINFPNKFMRAQSTELVATLFSECSEMVDDHLGLCGKSSVPVVAFRMTIAAILGFFLTSLTFGLRIPAGVILPTMCVGALYGRTLGSIMREWTAWAPNFFLFSACEPDVQCVTAGTYAIIGAAATLAGVTRMTVSIVVIMFELTGALTYVLPIMISVLISKWIGDAISPRGIYESWIRFQGYPFLDNRDDAAAASVPDVAIGHLITAYEDLVVLTAEGHTVGSLRDLVSKQSFRGYPVILDHTSRLLLGYISRTELDFALSTSGATLPLSAPARFAGPNTTLRRTNSGTLMRANSFPPTNTPVTNSNDETDAPGLDLRPWMDQTPITLSSRTTLQLTVNLFLKLGLRYVFFVERGRLQGVLTKKDVWMLLDGRELASRKAGTIYANEGGRLREDATSLGQQPQETGIIHNVGGQGGSADRFDHDDDDDPRHESRGLLGISGDRLASA